MPTLSDIRAARQRIADGVIVTPCPESIPLSEITGCRIFCKLGLRDDPGTHRRVLAALAHHRAVAS